MGIQARVHQMREVAPEMAAAPLEVRNEALRIFSRALETHAEEIFAANAQDCEAARTAGLPSSVQARLRFDEHKLADCQAGLATLIELADPLGVIQLDRELDRDLELKRISVPLGVVGVIFEARPDALVQIAALCIKSGNCAVLKGGKETAATNRVLFGIADAAARKSGLPAGCLLQAEAHAEIDELLACDDDVDLIVPRGSNEFVRYIQNHTRIPVLGHSAGICHVYVDDASDQALAIPVVLDSKVQYPAACNAAETLLVARSIAAEFVPAVAQALTEAGVALVGTEEVVELLHGALPHITCTAIPEDAFATEYGDLTLAIKLVDDVHEATRHINYFGSHHTDAIITQDDVAAAYFMQMVDSAGVYRNCSTRFADGFRYGFGAEVGIATGKIHARGPVGLEGLTTYKYELTGTGHVVGDYASGRAQFHFKDLI